MNKKIRGKIIRIIDSTTVVINLGLLHGIQDNSIFTIYGSSEAIIDPTTQEELGRIIVAKAKLKASQVYEKFTIAKSIWNTTQYSSALAQLNIPALMGIEEKIIEVGKELNIDPSQVQPWKALKEEIVRLGDSVEVSLSVEDPEGSKNDDSKDAKSTSKDP